MSLAPPDRARVLAAAAQGKRLGLYFGGTFGSAEDASGKLAPLFSANAVSAFHNAALTGGLDKAKITNAAPHDACRYAEELRYAPQKYRYFSLQKNGEDAVIDSISFVYDAHYAAMRAAICDIVDAARGQYVFPVIFGTDSLPYYAKIFALDKKLGVRLRKKKASLVFIATMQPLKHAPDVAENIFRAVERMQSATLNAGAFVLSPANADATKIALLDAALPLEKISSAPNRFDALQSPVPLGFTDALPDAEPSCRFNALALEKFVIPLGRGVDFAGLTAIAALFPNAHIAVSGFPLPLSPLQRAAFRQIAYERAQRGSGIFFCNPIKCASPLSSHDAPIFAPVTSHRKGLCLRQRIHGAPSVFFLSGYAPEELSMLYLAQSPIYEECEINPRVAVPFLTDLIYVPCRAWRNALGGILSAATSGVAVQGLVDGVIAEEFLRGLSPKRVEIGNGLNFGAISEKSAYAAGSACTKFTLTGISPSHYVRSKTTKRSSSF